MRRERRREEEQVDRGLAQKAEHSQTWQLKIWELCVGPWVRQSQGTERDSQNKCQGLETCSWALEGAC